MAENGHLVCATIVQTRATDKKYRFWSIGKFEHKIRYLMQRIPGHQSSVVVEVAVQVRMSAWSNETYVEGARRGGSQWLAEFLVSWDRP
jgi:hypothetical protein